MRHLSIGDHGSDVTALQHGLNARSKPRGLPQVVVDGAYGHDTDKAVDRVTRMLGVLEQTIQQSGCTVGQQRIVLHPAWRNPRQLVRARQRAQQAKEQAAAAAKAHPKVEGNTVTGGKHGNDRVVAAARAAYKLDRSGGRPSFYDQSGRFDATHAITGEHPGDRSDCSEWQIALSKSAGLPDPNGTDYTEGYTGSLANALKQIPWSQARPGDLVIWDPWGPEGHTAMIEDQAAGLCIGHGSRQIARHAISDFNYKGAARYYRRRGGE